MIRPTNAAFYIRVSSKDQAKKYSPAVQREILDACAKRDKVKAPEDRVFIDKQTGTNKHRPGFERVIALAKAGAIDTLYVMSVDRFARNTADALAVADLLTESKVRLVISNLNIDIQTPEGRMAFTQFASIAEYQAGQLKTYTRNGRARRLDHDHKPDHGSRKYGWHLIDGVYTTNPAEAPAIDLAIGWRMNDKNSWPRIAQRLNEAGYKPMRSKVWNVSSAQDLVLSKMNIGEHHRCGRIIPCPPRIDRATYDRLLAVSGSLYQKHCGRPSKSGFGRRQYLLRTFVQCKACTHRVLGHGIHTGIYYYRCGNLKRTPYAERLCFEPAVQATPFEEAVWTAIWSLLCDPDRLYRIARSLLGELEHQDTTGPLHKKLAHLSAKRERVIHLFKEGTIEKREKDSDLAVIASDMAATELELRAASKIVALPPLDVVKAVCAEITDPRDEPKTYDERRPILEAIREGGELEIVLDGKNVEIRGAIPVMTTTATDKNTDNMSGSGKKNLPRRFRSLVDIYEPIPFQVSARIAA